MGCNDSPFRFLSKNPTTGKKAWKDCIWAAAKNSITRCKWRAVSRMCPKTCNRCDRCKDGNTKVRFERSPTRMLTKNCKWTGKKKNWRCTFDGISDTCRLLVTIARYNQPVV